VSLVERCWAQSGGTIADRIGRRATLVWGGGIFIVGSILAPLSPNVATLILARGILGLAIGFTSVTAPVYVSELAPPQSRGMLIGLYQFALTVGIALSDLTGYLLARQQAWRLMFGIGALPAILFLFMVLTVPESPRWLFAQGRLVDAKSVLKTYTNEAGARLLLEDIRVSMLTKMERRWSALWSPAVRSALFIAGVHVLQQVTGINTIVYYGRGSLRLPAHVNKNAIFATLLVAIVNVSQR
jgi:MFS family permease